MRPRGRRSIWSWLRWGTWQPFELVLLDHGTYLDISDRIRVAYAQLWCALFAGDQVGGGDGGAWGEPGGGGGVVRCEEGVDQRTDAGGRWAFGSRMMGRRGGGTCGLL